MSKKKIFPKYNAGKVIHTLLEDPIFLAEIQQYAVSINAPEKELLKKAKKIFRQLASRYKAPGIHVSKLCIQLISSSFFSGVKVYGNTDHLQNDQYQYIYLPSHRSHMDYLFISYILYLNNIAPPHIAAGINLSFFPVGMVFRKLGAFFIRRRIAGNFLYLQCLKTYLRWLTSFPLGIELFIEGGRSRDGKIRKPQTGILQLIFESMGQTQKKPYKVVPISVTYDFTPEVTAYAREENGKAKKKESLFSLLQSLTRFENYHACHIHFLDPLDASEWIVQHGIEKNSMQKLSGQVLQSIQYATVVTPFQIIACAITALNQPLFEDDIYQACLHIKQYLESMGVLLSNQAQNFEQNFLVIIDKVIKKGWITRQPGFRYQISATSRITMSYYRYSILHFFVPALVSHVKNTKPELTMEIISHEFPVLAEKLTQKKHTPIDKPVIDQIAKSILIPYREVLQALHKESLGKIVHSLSIDIEKDLRHKPKKNKDLTYQKIKHAHDFLSRKSPDQIGQLETFLDALLQPDHTPL